MVAITEVVPDDHAYFVPMGDFHLGDAFFTSTSKEKLTGYVNWIKEHPNARTFLNGDIFNVATRQSKTSPFSINPYIIERQQTDPYFDEMSWAVEILTPIASQIIGATDGNHENRLIDFANKNILLDLCKKLSTREHIVNYCGISCLLFLKVGRPRKRTIKVLQSPNRSGQTYSIYLHHTTGGGSTVGGKLNRVAKLKEIVAGCDVYCGNHNHLESGAKTKIFLPDSSNCKIKEVRQLQVSCGGFLDYGGYAERGQLAPVDMGAPRLRLDSFKKDVHLSF